MKTKGFSSAKDPFNFDTEPDPDPGHEHFYKTFLYKVRVFKSNFSFFFLLMFML